ncbi:hypothetical protein MTO96_007149 [Rhipicephalus appendiculatus]
MSETMAPNPLGDSLLQFSLDLIAAALSMALAGARNNTAKQIADALHVNCEEVHKHFASFMSKLSGFAPDVQLHVANRMYSEETFPVLDSYLSLLRSSYDTTIESVDFKTHYEKVRQQVNAWVEQATESKIRDLLRPGSVDDLTTLVLVNAIYFKGLWQFQFDPYSTHRSNFHLDNNTKKEVEMMYEQTYYKMGRSEELGVTALEIPYRGGKASMLIILPNEVEGLSQLEDLLTNVELYLPKFKLEQTLDLKGTLTAMEIEDFFTPQADLTRMITTGNLRASEIFHKAFVEVNEAGTEAAAATDMKFILTSLAINPPRFVVDHPFMFLIRSHDPDAVLFMGSVRQL